MSNIIVLLRWEEAIGPTCMMVTKLCFPSHLLFHGCRRCCLFHESSRGLVKVRRSPGYRPVFLSLAIPSHCPSDANASQTIRERCPCPQVSCVPPLFPSPNVSHSVTLSLAATTGKDNNCCVAIVCAYGLDRTSTACAQRREASASACGSTSASRVFA